METNVQETMKWILDLAGKEYWRDIHFIFSSDREWKRFDTLVALGLIEQSMQQVNRMGGQERAYRLTRAGYDYAKEHGMIQSGE